MTNPQSLFSTPHISISLPTHIPHHFVAYLSQKMQVIRQYMIFLLCGIFIAANILNGSANILDAQPDCVSENFIYNDMQRIAETLLEKFFDIKNAVAEHGQQDTFDNELHIIAPTDYHEPYSSQFHSEVVPSFSRNNFTFQTPLT